MLASDNLKLAKQGNPEAIAAIMNKSLKPKGIAISATVTGNCLNLVAEAQSAPEQAPLVDLIYKGLSNLQPQSIERCVIQGKEAGQKQASWREIVDLSSQPHAARQSSVSIHPEPTSQAASDRFAILKNYANTALLAGILLTLLMSSLSGNRSQKTLWEYQIVGIDDGSFETTMQQKGAEGWELASARRALSGEGSSSTGLYEVILKRPTTAAQAEQNLKDAQAKLEQQKLEAAQMSGQIYVGSLNRGQQAYRLENRSFSPSIAALEIGVPAETDDYTYSITLEGGNKAIATATSKRPDLKSFTGAVTASGFTTEAIICQSDAPSTTAPGVPTLNGSDLQCAAGSSEAN